MSDITHRGWIIAPATIGYDIQHPDFDRENELDWRHGHTDTIEAARIEIDRLLTEDAEWTEAVSILKEGYTPKPPAGGDAGADAADILDHYARFIRDEVKADDLERHPYLPHIEQVAADLRAALALPAPVVEGVTERDVGALRYVLNWADTRVQARTILKAFTVEDGEKVTTEDRLEGLWRKLSAALSEGHPDA